MVTEVGAGLRAYTVGGHEVIDGFPENEMCSIGRGQLLLPWPNRIEDGQYEFAGRMHQTPLTEPSRNNALHGLSSSSTRKTATRSLSALRSGTVCRRAV